jgi:hypothetical protein
MKFILANFLHAALVAISHISMSALAVVKAVVAFALRESEGVWRTVKVILANFLRAAALVAVFHISMSALAVVKAVVALALRESEGV